MTFLQLKHNGTVLCLDKIRSVSVAHDWDDLWQDGKYTQPNEVQHTYWFNITYDVGTTQEIGYGLRSYGEELDDLTPTCNGSDAYSVWSESQYIAMYEDYKQLMGALGVSITENPNVSTISTDWYNACKDAEAARQKGSKGGRKVREENVL